MQPHPTPPVAIIADSSSSLVLLLVCLCLFCLSCKVLCSPSERSSSPFHSCVWVLAPNNKTRLANGKGEGKQRVGSTLVSLSVSYKISQHVIGSVFTSDNDDDGTAGTGNGSSSSMTFALSGPALALFALICAQGIYSMCLLLECQAWLKQVYHYDTLPPHSSPAGETTTMAAAVNPPHDTSGSTTESSSHPRRALGRQISTEPSDHDVPSLQTFSQVAQRHGRICHGPSCRSSLTLCPTGRSLLYLLEFGIHQFASLPVIVVGTFE